jgi:hypothetical protein
LRVCQSCETAAVNFYKFKIKIKRAQSSSFSLPLEEQNDEPDNSSEPAVLHTLDIVKNFIDRHSIESIIEDDREQRLIIGKPLPMTIERDDSLNIIETELIEENELSQDESIDEESREMDYEATEEETFEEALDSPTAICETTKTDFKAFEQPSQKTLIVPASVEFIDRQRAYETATLGDIKRKNSKTLRRNIDKLERNKARLRGDEYMTIKGKVIRAKKMKEPCKKECRLKCNNSITEEDRERNFKNYWGLGSVILQRKFIFEHRVTMPVKRRRSKNLQAKPRDCSSQYYLDKFNSGGTVEKVIVCEAMFSNTLDISKNFTAYMHKQVQTGVVQDRRAGRPQPNTPGHQAAIEQIKANCFFPIETAVSISKLYDQYIDACSKKKIAPVKSSTYRNLFKRYNECHFLKSETINCQVCVEYMRANEDDQAAMSETYEDHLHQNEKCLHRAKRRSRAAFRRAQNTLTNDDTEDGLIVEEHLYDEN